jgi:hypothetical protein
MPVDLFQKFLNKTKQVYGQTDKQIFGGFLPGGAASPVRQNINETIKGVAGSAMNMLPDRANLFARYVTGVGNKNLKLDESTLTDLRNAASPPPAYMKEIENPFKTPQWLIDRTKKRIKNTSPETLNSPLGKQMQEWIKSDEENKNRPDFITVPVAGYGPGVVQTGAVRPYGIPDIGKSVTNTLGSYNVTVDPGKSIRFTDVYDMINPSEDPDLVSGKFQPMKAIEEIQSIWDPTKGSLRRNMPETMKRQLAGQSKYGDITKSAKSPVASPATALGRALLYALPVKPQPYEVDITIPY